jgi:hypothetical protein
MQPACGSALSDRRHCGDSLVSAIFSTILLLMHSPIYSADRSVAAPNGRRNDTSRATF